MTNKDWLVFLFSSYKYRNMYPFESVLVLIMSYKFVLIVNYQFAEREIVNLSAN